MQITGTVQSQALHPEGRLVTVGTDDPAGPRVIVTTSAADADTLRIGRHVTVTIAADDTADDSSMG